MDLEKYEKLKREIRNGQVTGDVSRSADAYLQAYQAMSLQYAPPKETRKERRLKKKGKR